MSKKILFLTVLFAFFRISFVYSLEIIPLKKPLQSNEDKEKKLLIETTRPLPKPLKENVKEKIQVLDEVVVSPTRPEKFLDLQEEEFKKFDYTSDKSTRVDNEILRKNQLYEGVDFVNIFKLMYKTLRKNDSDKSSGSPYAPSDVIHQIYPDVFFMEELQIPPDQIGLFLEYIDDRLEAKDLLKKENEFQLMDYLIKQSEKFAKAK